MLRESPGGSSRGGTEGRTLGLRPLLKNHIGSVDPDALIIPARRAEYSLSESALSPFHAEPEHKWFPSIRRLPVDFQMNGQRQPSNPIKFLAEVRGARLHSPGGLRCREKLGRTTRCRSEEHTSELQ